MKYKISATIAVTALLVVSSVVAVVNSPVEAPAADRATPKTEQGQATQLSPEQVRLQKAAVIGAAGRGAIQHIDAARSLLAEHKADEAAESLAVATQILGQIKLAIADDGALPDAELDAGLMIPLLARLGLAQEADLSDELKQSLSDLAPLVASGEHDQVIAALKRFDLSMTYSYVEMPLKTVSDDVAAATLALKDGDQNGADAYLKAAIDATISTTVTIGESVETAPVVDEQVAGDAGHERGGQPAGDHG